MPTFNYYIIIYSQASFRFFKFLNLVSYIKYMDKWNKPSPHRHIFSGGRVLRLGYSNDQINPDKLLIGMQFYGVYFGHSLDKGEWAAALKRKLDTSWTFSFPNCMHLSWCQWHAYGWCRVRPWVKSVEVFFHGNFSQLNSCHVLIVSHCL